MKDKYVAYVGSYTRGSSKGINIFDVDVENCRFSPKGVAQISNPSYIKLSSNKEFLYCSCDEGVGAFKIQADGSLEFLNKASVNGLRPCYIDVDTENKYLVTAGYHDGKISVLKINEDGSVGSVTDEVFMKGLGTVIGKSYECHVNCTRFTPGEKCILAVDQGMDQVKIYDFNKETGKIKLKDILRCELESGPRHMVFTADGKNAYMTHETSSYVTVYSFDAGKTVFTKLQTISTIPEGYDSYNNAVTLRLTDDNKHLLATNSGNNSVAVYDIDPETRMLTTVCILPVSGDYPRDLLIMPDGRHVAFANKEEETLTCFTLNYENNYIAMCGPPVKTYEPTSMQLKKL